MRRVGACASVVLARAMVRDLYAGERAAQMMSTLMTVMAIAPLLGPIVGGQILNLASWRAIFWTLVGVGIATLLALLTLPETLARDSLGYILTGIDALRSGRWPLKDRDPCPLETTIPGILAAGDIRAGSTKRVGFAVGDGSLAVTCVHKLTAIRQ